MRVAKEVVPGTQRQILDAALSSFAESGYAAATLTDIRKKAGVSVGSLYHWFSSKEALGLALYLEGLGAYQAGLLAALEKSPGAEEGLRGVVEHHLRWVEEHPDLARHLLTMRQAEFLTAAKERIRQMNKTLYAGVDRWRGPHVEQGVLDDMPLELFISVVMGPSQDFTRLWLAGRARTPMKAAIRKLGAAAWRGARS